MPSRGIVEIFYYSGERKGRFGCRPDVKKRKMLMHLVYIDEIDIIETQVPDDDYHKLSFDEKCKILEGYQTYRNNIHIWDTYFCPLKKKPLNHA